MTTQKQIEANCQNAQLSTGPITVIGKADRCDKCHQARHLY